MKPAATAWACTGAPTQRFSLRGLQLLNVNSKLCVQSADGGLSLGGGAAVFVGECAETPAFQWRTA